MRYTGFATSRELGAAVAGFSPLISVALLDIGAADPAQDAIVSPAAVTEEPVLSR